MLWIAFVLHIIIAAKIRATENNYLYPGCSISESIQDIFTSSLSVTLRYPLADGFTLNLWHEEDTIDYLNYNRQGNATEKQQWIPMKLVMEGRLELQFENGTTFLMGRIGRPIDPFPGKHVSLQNGALLPNCPQGLPNWKIQRSISEEHVPIYDGSKETFSIIANTQTKLPFEIGNEKLFLCLGNTPDITVVLPMSNGDCQRLLPLRVIWLQVAYRNQMIEISDPLRPSTIMRSFHMEGSVQNLTFKDHTVEGTVYVVHHTKGFHKSRTLNSVHLGDAMGTNPEDMCLLISTIAGVGAFLIIVILCLMTVLFYNRWINVRQILLVLGAQENNNGKRLNIKNSRDRDINGKPSMPSRPHPNINKPMEGAYLTPRELKKLDEGGFENRPRSEHVYEDMVFTGWTKKDHDTLSKAKVNKGFNTPENHYETPKK